MTDNGLAAFYRRYHACCNEHGFEDLREFVARDVVINGIDRGLDAYADGLRAVVRSFPDYRWELRHLVVDAPWIAAHFAETGAHRGALLGVEAGASDERAQLDREGLPEPLQGGAAHCFLRRVDLLEHNWKFSSHDV
jgi:predicted ester cyclase